MHKLYHVSWGRSSMKGKRRDKKGRILQPGEYQNKETGRYYYKYTDSMKKRKTVYSWCLIPTDRPPSGVRQDKCLRDKIKDIEKEQSLGVWHDNTTVCQLVDRYLTTKTGVRQSTRGGYRTVQNILRKEPFGQLPIYKVKLSDAKLFFIKLQRDGKGFSSIHTIRGVLRPAFQMAVDDEMLIRNPFEFQLASVVVNDSVKREALSPADEKRFLEFIKEDAHYSRYYDGIFILLNTGLRISEFCALTKRDIDFNENILHVERQLLRTSNMQYVIETTKTSSGTRHLPMSEEVRDAFKRILANRKRPKAEPIIHGYSGFLYLDKDDKPMLALHWQHYFKRAVNKYNSSHKLQLPVITPHVCRHTYCSKMARAGMNPKALQYLMGHSEIAVTMNVYTHLGSDDARAEMMKMGLLESEKTEIKMFKSS